MPIGERITCAGFSGDPDEKLNEKPGKAPLEVIFPELKTNADAKPVRTPGATGRVEKTELEPHSSGYTMSWKFGESSTE